MADKLTMYVLIKRGYYFRLGAKGYTGLKDEAGKFTEEESALYVVDDSEGSTTRRPYDEADLFSPECDVWVQRDYWKRRALAEESRADGLQRRVLELEGRK